MSVAKKKAQTATQYHCRECQHSYDWHEKNWQGELFMCRCKFGKWSKFLSDKQCDKFELRNGEKE